MSFESNDIHFKGLSNARVAQVLYLTVMSIRSVGQNSPSLARPNRDTVPELRCFFAFPATPSMAEVSEEREPSPDMQGEGYVVPLLTVEVQVQTSEYCLQNQGMVATTAFRFTHTRNVTIRINLGRFDVRWRSPTGFINAL